MSSANPVIQARGLRKSFGKTEILRGLDFTIPAGRIYGLVGHNGAGKTTTLNAVLGLTDYDGSLSVFGKNPYQFRADLMNDVAFISDVASLPRFLRVHQLFELVADIHPSFNLERAHEFLQGTDLRPNLKIKALSKGMMAQLHLSVVMAIDAKLLILDEPTLGLDITYRKRFYRRLIEDYMHDERTIIITTHQVDEIEPLLTDVMFIKDGELVLDCATDALESRFVQLITSAESAAELAALKPVHTETSFGQVAMVFDGVDVEKLRPHGELSTPNLSDLFVALMQREAAIPGDK